LEDTAVFGVGAWLLLCPIVLDLNSSAVDMFVTVGAGVVMAGLAGVAMLQDRPWVEGAIVAWGAVFAALPWALGFVVKAAVINAVACGVLTIALASWRVYDLCTRRAAEPAVPVVPKPADAAGNDKRRAA
jgi:hypothetical protein